MKVKSAEYMVRLMEEKEFHWAQTKAKMLPMGRKNFHREHSVQRPSLPLQRPSNLFDVEAAGRGIDDVLVDAAHLVNLVRVAGLLYAAVLQGVDHLAVDYLGYAVRDDDYRPVLLDGVNAVLDLLRGYGVQRGRGFVQEDDGRVLEEHPGDGDALLLAAGQV